MATFDVKVRHLDAVEPHPNADRLELAVVGDYRAVVAKGQFQAGDAIAYLPEASVLPAELIAELGLTGKLAGPDANRVHAVRLRGALSQGVVMAARAGWTVGQSVMAELGVTKFEPEIPKELQGSVYALEREEGLSFDLENIKAFPNVFQEGETVVLTEKIHGVFLGIGAVPARLARPDSGHYQGRAWVSSKGLLSDRLAFDHRSEDEPNIYLRAAQQLDLYAVVMKWAQELDEVVFLLGETFGQGVQDLGYGAHSQTPDFRAFSVVIGTRFLDDEELEQRLAASGLKRATVLYRGPFSMATVLELTRGKESVSGQERHLREGVVITPVKERMDFELGRVALKSVSEDYLLRKGGTEFS
jgi:RNA ligase (TIGR02306 family)